MNGVLVAVLRVPAIIATLGTLSAYRGFTLLLAGGKQITLTQLPAGYTDWARGTVIVLPLFVVIALVVVTVAALVLRQTTFGRQVYAVGSNPEAAEILGIRTRLITIVDVRRLRPARGRRRRHVGHGVRDDQRHRGDRRHAPGHRGRGRRRREHQRRLGDRGRRRARRAVPGVHPERADPAAAVAVLAAGDLRPRDPHRGRPRRRAPPRRPALARPGDGGHEPPPARYARPLGDAPARRPRRADRDRGHACRRCSSRAATSRTSPRP